MVCGLPPWNLPALPDISDRSGGFCQDHSRLQWQGGEPYGVLPFLEPQLEGSIGVGLVEPNVEQTESASANITGGGLTAGVEIGVNSETGEMSNLF